MSVDPRTAEEVRTALLDSGFTAEGVLARIGPDALGALGRELTEPARRALAVPGATGAPAQTAPATLDTLIRLFLLGQSVAATDLPAALASGLRALGLVGDAPANASVDPPGDRLRALLDLRPYGEPDTDWYLVSDRGGPEQADHVLGLGGASLTLARITPRGHVGKVLDLGCGAGVQVLHAARHAEQIIATDTNPRALRLTALSAALSAVPAAILQLREGSLFEPVAGERFDLIVSNPPFVISPRHRFTYRDSGLPGDELSRRVVRGAADHLAPGGRATVLATWLHRAGQTWQERVGSWLDGTSVDAWVVQRDVQDVVEYAATWLRDAGTPEPDLDAALGAWLDEFATLGAHAVGFGWVVLAAPPAARDSRGAPWLVAEDLAASPRLPDADEVEGFLTGCTLAERLGAVDLLGGAARLADGVRIVRTSVLLDGKEVSEPPVLELPPAVGPMGWRPGEPVSVTLLAALQDPSAESLGVRLDRAAERAGMDPLDVLPVALARLRELVRVGIVRP